MNKKTKIILATFSTIATLSLTSMMLTSCSTANHFVFGNFQSYMSPNVKNSLDKQLKNVNWQSFASNNEIPTYLTNKTINASVASNNMIVKLKDYSMIEKIDWSLFNLIKTSNPNNPDDYELVKNSNDLEGVVTDLTFKVATEGFKEFGIDNLLDYCFPYFLQNFVFVYRGKEIPELSGDNVTFTDIFRIINKDPRFLSNQAKPNVLMVKDSRTIYGLSQILADEQKILNGENIEVNINPDVGLINDSSKESKSIEDLISDYRNVKNAITDKNLKIGLNSDSNVLINKIVLNEVQGAFMYNGDAVFAGLGGDYGGSYYNNQYVDYPDIDNFHVVVPKNTLIALDGIVLNKENNQTQKEESLKIAYDLTISGANIEKFNEWNTPLDFTNEEIEQLDPRNLNILDKNDDDSYTYLVTENFDYINYTPTLQKLYDSVTNINGNNYFLDYLCSLRGIKIEDSNNELKELANLLSKVLAIQVPNKISNVLEMPLNKLTDSNMQIAFTVLVNEIPG
ncbi:MAG: hypothetical protein K2K73_01090 [Ureaplasma sp.]|nr:hypothetical protein [Ureaplasma sp.]